MPNSSGVFEAGGLNPGVAVDSNAALQLPMAKVFKVSVNVPLFVWAAAKYPY
jgi:hypothetical protein